MTNKSKIETKILVLGAVMTAIVLVFQLIGSYTNFFGVFASAVALVPIVIGASMCGPKIGAWLGFVFGASVLAFGQAALFFAFNVPGTIVTVLLKGTACGLVAGLIYKLLEKYNRLLAVIVAAIACPIVNTGIFLLGCYVFFMDSATAISSIVEIEASGMALFWAIAMGNFLIELGTSAVLSPVIVRILNFQKKQ